MTGGRTLWHPGPRAQARFAILPCRAHPVELHLDAGLPFDEAVARAFAAQGFAAGYLRLQGAQFRDLHYVIPARAPGDGRAAWYSATHRLRGALVAEAGLHLGRRQGAPFLHCHGLWAEAGGEMRAGHLLSPESVLAEGHVAQGWGVSGAMLEVAPDPETGFDLFAPVAVAGMEEGGPARLVTIRPNEDPHAILARIARTLPRSRVEGLGSLVHTCFAQDRLDSYATEVLVQAGHVENGVAHLLVAAVGFDGVLKAGLLQPHGNRICITAELLLIEDV